ncbi:hypothetical protein KR009_000601, partial [Drosophila setifemur]
MSHGTSSTPTTPPPSRRSQRPPRINIHNPNSGPGMSQSSIPPSAQPPQTAQTNYTGIGTQGPYWPPVANPFGYGNFMSKGYEGFLDLTKSGLSFGERFTFALYNKFSKWSRRWFTHMFLIIVLALYSIGGAVLFRTIESRQRDFDVLEQQSLRRKFIKEMVEISEDPVIEVILANFEGSLIRIMNVYPSVVESILRKSLDEKEDPWSFWNAMVYSCTIYTTIGE